MKQFILDYSRDNDKNKWKHAEKRISWDKRKKGKIKKLELFFLSLFIS
jgi:hypothetical protein